MSAECMLVIGARGQIGAELVDALAGLHGEAKVIAADLSMPREAARARFERLDVLDSKRLGEVVDRYKVTQIWHLAAFLSATGEQAPLKAWTLNTGGLLNVLELAREKRLQRVFWPSSIAAFGPTTPKRNTPQLTVMEPATMYGISKLSGEHLCDYYHARFGVDVRSLRYPGVIGYKTPPGGGTTDYAVDIFQAARRGETYSCYLQPETTLPMIYMPDAIRAALELMDADAARIRVRTSYNVAGLSFSPAELAAAIRRRVPTFQIAYRPDFRQAIADTWPQAIDDSAAHRDWDWRAGFDLGGIVSDMLQNVPLEWAGARASAQAA